MGRVELWVTVQGKLGILHCWLQYFLLLLGKCRFVGLDGGTVGLRGISALDLEGRRDRKSGGRVDRPGGLIWETDTVTRHLSAFSCLLTYLEGKSREGAA